MSLVIPLIQTVARISALSLWENCAFNIIEKNRPSSVTLFCKSAVECPSTLFYRVMRNPWQTIFGEEIHELPALKESELVLISGLNNIEWNNKTIWKYRVGGKNRFKIVLVAYMDQLEHLGRLFEAMWLSGVVNIAVLIQNGSSVEVFTYLPFKSKFACGDSSPVLLGDCETAVTNIFEINKIANLNKCPIRVTLRDDTPFFKRIPFTGRLVRLIREIEHRMNFTIVTMEPLKNYNGGLCGPEEFTGVRGQVVKGDADIGIGSFDKKECSVLEYMDIPFTHCYTWCTPVLPENNYVSFLVNQFRPLVWVAIFVTASIVVVSVVVVCYVTKELVTSNEIINIVLLVYAQPLLKRSKSSEVRLILGVWLLACLVIRSAFEGELKSQRAVRVGFRIIDDLDELFDTNLPLCTVLGSLRVLEGIDEAPIKKVASKTTICNGSLYENIIAAAELKDRAVFSTSLRCKIISYEANSKSLQLYTSTGGCLKMYQMKPIVTFPGSPLIDKMRIISQRCDEAGLVQYWLDLKSTPPKLTSVQPYSVRDVIPALFVLAFGSFASSVVFLAEFACKNLFFIRSKILNC